MKKWVPFSYNAFENYRLNSVNVSNKGLEVIKKLIKGEKVTQEESGLGKREWGELMDILK